MPFASEAAAAAIAASGRRALVGHNETFDRYRGIVDNRSCD
jgi:hypothetical protein